MVADVALGPGGALTGFLVLTLGCLCLLAVVSAVLTALLLARRNRRDPS
jgi:hypothetical protein